MNICIIYGTRPEFLKLKILIETFKRNNVNFSVLKVNQHEHFQEDCGYYNNILDIEDLSKERISNIGSNILKKLPEYIKDNTHVLCQGDTATVFYSLLCAYQMRKKCIHLEAGMRTYDLENPFPEECFRQMISRFTDIHLCPSELEKNNLIKEGILKPIYVVGNTILDLVKSYKYDILDSKSILITLHRRENWNDFKHYFIEFINLSLNNPNFLFYFFTHPNPTFKKIINEINMIIPKNFLITDSKPHNELIKLLSECKFVITDSGGIQEEANFLGKHIYLIRKVTERKAICEKNLTLCSISDIKNINFNISNDYFGLEYGDGNSSNLIYDILFKD